MITERPSVRTLATLALAVFAMLSPRELPGAPGYDPLAASPGSAAKPANLVVHDEARQREIPVRIYLTTDSGPRPVVLFSHGLGGSREGSVFFGRHWSARGYVAVFLQHPGSDDSVWKGRAPAERMSGLKQAAGLKDFLLRVQDVPAVIDQLERWNATRGHILAGRMDLARLGMSGHSFGAVTTQAVSGQRFAFGRSFTDPRIKAAVIMSPSAPRLGAAGPAFGSVRIPWLLLTGTQDMVPFFSPSVDARLKVFPALPAGDKFELVLDGAEHSIFTDRALSFDRLPRNPNHHRAILAITTAFWDAFLRGDVGARAWLDGSGPRSALESADRWRRK